MHLNTKLKQFKIATRETMSYIKHNKKQFLQDFKQHNKGLIFAIIMFIIAMLFFAIFVGCKSTKGLISTEFTALKANEDVNAIKNEVKGDITALKGEIKKLAEIQLKAVSNEKHQTSGRDMTTTTTNETVLMKYIIYAFLTIVLGLIGFMKFAYTKSLKNKELEKKFYKDLYLAMFTNSASDIAEIRKKQAEYIQSKGRKL